MMRSSNLHFTYTVFILLLTVGSTFVAITHAANEVELQDEVFCCSIDNKTCLGGFLSSLAGQRDDDKSSSFNSLSACHGSEATCISKCQGEFVSTRTLDILENIQDEMHEDMREVDYETLKSKYPNLVLFTGQPSTQPTANPTREPKKPTDRPTRPRTPSPTTPKPTESPSLPPTPSPTKPPPPTRSPTAIPTLSPSASPTASPSVAPTTARPTPSPSAAPTSRPTTDKPTRSPTSSPTKSPTVSPTASPSAAPTTARPTPSPSAAPTSRPTTDKPTRSPTSSPTKSPTASPTFEPTQSPSTAFPTNIPTRSPTAAPTPSPTTSPTPNPTKKVTGRPTSAPTETIDFTETAQMSCATANKDGRGVTTPLDAKGGDIVHLKRSNQLCTLWQIDSKRDAKIPVGRSYLGHKWEPYGGEFSHVTFLCDESACSIILPDLPFGYEYEMVAFDHELSERDQIARFLEQATFGPSRKDLDAFADASPETFASWVKEQQETVKMSSHRAFYREHLSWPQEFVNSRGLSTTPCQAQARYRRYAFGLFDVSIGNEIELKTDTKNRKIIYDDAGFLRTVLNTTKLYIGPPEDNKELRDGTYAICSFEDNFVGKQIKIGVEGIGCMALYYENGEEFTNPPVFYDSETPPSAVIVDLNRVLVHRLNTEECYIKNDLNDPNCDLIPAQRLQAQIHAVGLYQGQYWHFDPQITFHDNDVDDPMRDGGGWMVEQTRLTEAETMLNGNFHVQCSNPGLNFLNADGCMLSEDPEACSVTDPSDKWIPLDEDTFEKVYEGTGSGERGTRYVYVVEGLRQEKNSPFYDSPCTPGQTSRWVPTDCGFSGFTAADSTEEIFEDLLEISHDDNPYMRDVTFPAVGVECHPSDTEKFDFKVKLRSGSCWQNVHQSNLQVYDFTRWVSAHPGGEEKITQFVSVSENSKFHLMFPSWHGMDRFETAAESITEVGRYGDSIRFSSLPSELTDDAVAEALDARSARANVGPTLVCGSPFEVRSVPSKAGPRYRESFGQNSEREPRIQAWVAVALAAEDSLRQRVAWALSQIFSITEDAISGSAWVEPWMVYYDIFVRHAFGNYRDILKEVSFSVMMGEMLSYHGNIGTDYTWRTKGRIEYADENFAREIMQLFSVGPVKINEDGTPLHDGEGKTALTYTNNEIMEYARVWTGLERSNPRANAEVKTGGNLIDPMRIKKDYRDSFPKLGLERTYVGDGLPLCTDLPDKHFLKPGATYILLGASSAPKFLSEPYEWAHKDHYFHMKLDEESQLYTKLCDPNIFGYCNYKPRITLEEKLSCHGTECEIESPRIIEVGKGIFYEYQRLPCSYQAFFSDGRAVGKYNILRGDPDYTCADQRTQDGSMACCSEEGERFRESEIARFTGEKVSYSEMERVCTEAGMVLCEDTVPNCWDCDADTSKYWTSKQCSQQAKISPDGRVGLVHSFPQDGEAEMNPDPRVRGDTKTYFGVEWTSLNDSMFRQSYGFFCDVQLKCDRDPYDNLCLCSTQVKESRVFHEKPSPGDVLNNLHIGAFSPSVYWDDYVVEDLGNGVKMYSRDGKFSSESVFEVIDRYGVQQFRKNLRSEVVIGQVKNVEQSFRNPLHMISLFSVQLRDVYYETDAALDHYFYHENTAPFVAIRFAQRFGISNPSPHYVGVMSKAFREGYFEDDATGVTFGSGKYGDLAAMTAAMLLDRESRSVVLDADPAHGSLLEPFLKVVRLMKSLEYTREKDDFFATFRKDLHLLIGQAPHMIPNVFSFFLPEFQPRGAVGNSGMVCPECQVLTSPRMVTMMNGLLSLLKYGLDLAYGGFGTNLGHRGKFVPEHLRVLGEDTYAVGSARYSPRGMDVDGVVDELATLLTSGRLSQQKRDLLKKVYEEYDGAEALINVQQLIVTSPEFHTNGLARTLETPRVPPLRRPPSDKPYRAVVQVQLTGGWDSFGVLVPDVCSGKNTAGSTIDDQFRQVRGDLAKNTYKSPFRVDAPNSQPCSKFVIHEQIPILKDLYDEDSLVFIANAGVLNTANTNRENFNDETVTTLFAHNFMSWENAQVDPYQEEQNTGVLGRMASVLRGKGYSTSAISINNPSRATEGDIDMVPIIMSTQGPTTFNRRPAVEEHFNLTEYASIFNAQSDDYTSLFGDTWSNQFVNGIDESDFMTDILSQVDTVGSLKGTYGFEMISKLMQTKDMRGTDRDVYYTTYSTWDSHSGNELFLEIHLKALNDALSAFVEDLKDKDLWDKVAIVITSDFGRTITGNANAGTDHAWGGHYMVFGGAVKGGFLGEYPSDLTDDSPLNVGRGRFIPTTPWESIWYGVGEWMGLEGEAEMKKFLPNVDKATASPDVHGPFTKEDMFRRDTRSLLRSTGAKK